MANVDKKSIIQVLLICLAISGCSISIDGEKYKTVTPNFDLVGFFEGDIKAWGIVQNRSGNVVQRFTVDIKGTYENDTLTLDEFFTYGLGDGVKTRVWTINKTSDTAFRGTAPDILNEAREEIYGNAIKWEYSMDLPVGDATYKVKFEDWMWAFDEKTIVNRSYIKKFGLVMAEVTLFMQKQP